MSIPVYAIGDQHDRPLNRQLSDAHADLQPALDAWLAAEYWPCRDGIVAAWAEPVVPGVLERIPFLPPLIETLVASKWLRHQLDLVGMGGGCAERLVERLTEIARGAPPWLFAARVLSEVEAGHLADLLAEPPPSSCSIDRAADGTLRFYFYFGQRVIHTAPVGGSR